ncbi:PilZ domain-containing protein [Marivivens niveibacter]|uniref:PilZ domain-containing protein n=1 Tax=Marivivens niveibacter TaxID=1930667 RepID=UPI001F0A3359|nr:PilZ domain-containing protein [Marivivens niveibacter]
MFAATFGISIFAFFATRKTRRAQRYACHIKTIVQIDDDKHDATLFDISREGAKVKFHSGPNAIDRPMSVHLETGAISAQKMWANAHYCGLKFGRPLSKSDLATLVPAFFN